MAGPAIWMAFAEQADVSLTELALQGAVLNLLFADRRHGNNLILLLR